MNQQNSSFWRYITLIVIYLWLSMFLPLNPQTASTYHLSGTEYRVLLFAIALPYVIIWLIAFFGYSRLRQYSRAIERTSEGKHFNQLANGVMWLVWGLPISSLISSITNSITSHSAGSRGAMIILSHYVTLAIALVAFTYISKATRGLTDDANVRLDFANVRLLMAVFIVIGVAFCYITLHNIPAHAGSNPYHMPVILILLTIVVPYLYAWFLGLLAAYEASLYAKNVKGVLYQQSLRLLAGGIVGIILTSITLQYLTSVTIRLTHLTLNAVLLLIYVMLILYAAGYLLVAMGATKLKRIEEV